MKVWRYQIREQVEIEAPVERVYHVASDPKSVPLYAPEVARIDLLKRFDERTALVRSHLRVARLKFACLYRYNYRPPTHYSGVQEGGRFLRGYFSFTFRQQGSRTLVSHAEGIQSSIPGIAWLVGFVYFRLLSGGGLRKELVGLKELVESRPATQDGSLEAGAALTKSTDPTIRLRASHYAIFGEG